MEADNAIHKKVKIEVRHNPNQEWFKVAILENISLENGKEIIKTIQESNSSMQDREYRCIEC